MSDISKAREDVAADMAMVLERFPELAPRLQQHMVEVEDEIQGMFQPIFDLADGKITHEEFCTIVEKERQLDLERRRQHWAGAFDAEAQEWTVQCEDCCDTLVFTADEGPPSMYPQCEDCEAAEEADDEEEEDDQP